jgi:hypothetical protein
LSKSGQLAQGFRDDLMRAQFKLESIVDLQAKLAAQLERAEEARIRELALITRNS